MAVIYLDPNNKWGPINQALMNAIGKVGQEYQDQQTSKAVMAEYAKQQGLPVGDDNTNQSPKQQTNASPNTQPQTAPYGPSGDPSYQVLDQNTQGPSAGEPNQQMVTPENMTAAQKVGTTQAMGVNTGLNLPPPPKPPNMAALMTAAKGNPKAIALAKGIEQNYSMQRQQWAEQRQMALADRTFAQGEQRMQLAYDQFSNRLQQQDIVNKREDTKLDIAKQKNAREESLFPLTVAKDKVAIAKDATQLKQLQQEQSTLWKPQEIQTMAEQYAARGFENPPTFGLGRGAAAVNRNNFWRAVANLPMTAEQRREATLAMHMDKAAVAAGGRQLQSLNVQILKSEQLRQPIQQEFDKLKPILGNAIMWNRFKKAVLTGTGDPAFSKADVYVNSFLQAYAKAQNPNGLSTDDLRKTVAQYLDTVSSFPQLQAKMEAIKVDLQKDKAATVAGVSEAVHGISRLGVFGTEGNSGGPTGSNAGAATGGGSDNNPAGLDLN